MVELALGAFSTNKTNGKIPPCATNGKYAIICGVKGKMAEVAGSKISERMSKMTSEDREVRQFLKWKREQERVAAKKAFAKRIAELNHSGK